MPLKHIKNLAALIASAFLAAGCGGSKETQPEQPAQPAQSDNSWLQLTPSTMDVSVDEGSPQTLTITAKSSKPISQFLFVGVVDNAGVIGPGVRTFNKSPSEYEAALWVSSKLKPGSYHTRLEVRLCEDQPSICAQPVKGSPWYVPLNVVVKPGNNLKQLSDLPNVGTWQGEGGSFAHTSYIPASFDPAQFTTRFFNSIVDEHRSLVGNLTIENGAYYMSVGDARFSAVNAFDEATNAYKGGQGVSLGGSLTSAPAVVGDQVFYATNYRLRRVNKATWNWEMEDLKIGYDPEWIQGHSGGLLLGGSDTINRVNPDTLKVEWTAKLPSRLSAEPAADADKVYVFTEANLSIYRASDGALVSAPFSTSNRCTTSAVHATDGKGALYGVCSFNSGAELRAIDTLSMGRKWSVDGAYKASVALAGTTLYALNAGVLEARDTGDGKLLWSTNLLTGPDALLEADKVLVTDNLVFVSSEGPSTNEGGKTVAVDLATHKVVWAYPHGGKMAISSKGILYIGGNNSSRREWNIVPPFIAAINLR